MKSIFGRVSLWCALISFCLWSFSINARAYDLRANAVAFEAPVDIRHAGDGSGRLFLVMQEGQVRVFANRRLEELPFLDISDRVADPPADFFEEYNYGLLSIAFSPDFASSGLLYVYYTNNDFIQTVSRFRASPGLTTVNASTEEVLLEVPLPYVSHNGGHLVFGPDGYLYISVGDGQLTRGATDAPQRLDNLAGKILRIDVNPGVAPYGIPPDNPFLGVSGARPEIWAYGLRNPWRIAFDSLSGDLYIADVGELEWEEVNYQPARSAGGQNYGWPLMEGTHCHSNNPNCSTNGLTLPVAEFSHDGSLNSGCAVIGGEVYRGSAYPELNGRYLFGDGCEAKIWTMKCMPTGCQVDEVPNSLTFNGTISHDVFTRTFGKSEDGSIYFSSGDYCCIASQLFKLSDGPTVEEPGFTINAGLNDAWYNPDTSGQGFFVTVYPRTQILFAGFFTFEVSGSPTSADAVIGDGAHRWLTAMGPWSGDSATLDIQLTTNGAFDDPRPVERHDGYGSLAITFNADCMRAQAHVIIPSAAMDRLIPLERVSGQNRQGCLDLAARARIH